MSPQDPDPPAFTPARAPVGGTTPPESAGSQEPDTPGRHHAVGDDTVDAQPPVGRRRRRATVALVATSAALVVSFGLAGYLYWTALEWQREAESLTSRNGELEQEVDGLSTDLEQTRDELASANDRLLELAGEHAQTTDEREALEQLADRNAELADENAALAQEQNEIAVTASTAAARLSECASGQHELLERVLAGNDSRDEIDSRINDVNEVCRTAQQARDALARLLEG